MSASAGHQLAAQGKLVEGRIKTLVNNDLRVICRSYNQIVSGTKIQLQARCINILQGLVNRGDVEGFNAFSTRVSNHGYIPQTVIKQPNYTPTPLASSMSSSIGRPAPLQGPRFEFKQSPFYERLEVVVRATDLPEMPQNRHTVKCNLVLTDDQARRLSSDPDQYRLMVYCAIPILGSYSPVDIAFPPQIELKVNEDDVKWNFKGLKNKPGTTKPADITKFVRARAGYTNKVTVCYALTQKRYIFTIFLVRYVSTLTLTQRIRSARVFPKAKVLEEYARKNADSEIVAMSSKMSLKDPISTLRITMPVRSTVCEHNQCFDASFYLQLQEQAPSWLCPICNKVVSFESLGVDKYFEEILQGTQSSIEQVTVQPNGEWSVVKDDQEKGMSNVAKRAPRAAYDDDFDDDDDVVELDADLKAKPSLANIFSTPPASSRETSVIQPQSQASKRASAVIDLTLSDDDDESVRPAKRSRISESATLPAQPTQIQTPASLRDNPFSAPTRPVDPISRPATVATLPRPLYPNASGSMQAALPPSLPNPQPTGPTDRPPAMVQRTSSHSSTHSLPPLYESRRSPSATFGVPGGDFTRGWPGYRGSNGYVEPSTSTMPSWPAAQPPRPPTRAPMLPSLSSVGSYLGFAQDQTARSPPMPTLPGLNGNITNGYGHPPAPPR